MSLRALAVLFALASFVGCSRPDGLSPTDGPLNDLFPCDVDPTTACAEVGGTTCAIIVDTTLAAKCVPDDICDRLKCIVGECLFDKEAKFPNVRCVCGADVRCSASGEAERDDELREKQILD